MKKKTLIFSSNRFYIAFFKEWNYFEYYTFICFLISISVICINGASFAKRYCSGSYNSHIAQNANSYSRGMQLRCRCVRGRVAEKLHELQCVRRMNSGWNEEKLMAGDRRHGCHSLFFSCFGDGDKRGCMKRTPRSNRLWPFCRYQNILSTSLVRSDNSMFHSRREEESNAISRVAHLILFSLNKTEWIIAITM